MRLSSPKLQCDKVCTHAFVEADADGSLAQLAANETPCENFLEIFCVAQRPEGCLPLPDSHCRLS